MSEYWVSKKKYFCKYCDIYIADDAPSRQHHENGMRHKGNLERFIRGIYKTGEKHKKDLEEEKREMKRVEQAAAAAFAQDVGAGLAKGSSGPIASTSTAAKKPPPPKPSNPYANYSTAESLGYTDPDAERLAAELEARRSQGVAGEWQVITPVQHAPAASSSTTPHAPDLDAEAGPSESEAGGVKREADGPPPEEDTRTFKLRKKTLNTGLGEIYDPGFIPIKIKKKEPDDPQLAATSSAPGPAKPVIVKAEENGSTSSSSGPAKWAKPQWAAPLPDLKQGERQTIFGKQEEESAPSLVAESLVLNPDIKEEEDVKLEDVSASPAPASGSMFKKRKAPTKAGRGRREI